MAASEREKTAMGNVGRQGGFTALELPIVVSIIAVLINVLIPAIQTVREAASRADPCATPVAQPTPAPIETEAVDIKGELSAITVVDTAKETFRYVVKAEDLVVGTGLETDNEWHLVGGAEGSASLDTPVQLLHGFRLVGKSPSVAGEIVPVELQVFFAFDKDFKAADVAVLGGAVDDPCD